MNKFLTRLAVGVGIASPVAAFADAPLDLAATGTTIAGYVGAAAGAGLPIFAAMVGIGIIVAAFSRVGKRK